jgi:hypothetical protein
MATTSTDEAHVFRPAPLEGLRTGELELIGRLIGSSNNAMVVRVRPAGVAAPAESTSRDRSAEPLSLAPGELLAVWKPTRGERPLFDFPIGSLTRREVAAYLVSQAMGLGIVPPTLLRDGPFGEGMLQQWVDIAPDADVVAMIQADDPRLRWVALFDAVINNTDRKAGHLLPVEGGRVMVVDHGVTFSEVPKLRTVLWAWEAEPFEPAEVVALRALAADLDGALGAALRELLSDVEVIATRQRVAALLATACFPSPSPDWPAVPWPPY